MEITNAFAKLTGVQRAVIDVVAETEGWARNDSLISNPRRLPSEVQRYYVATARILGVLRKCLPGLYDDFPEIDTEPDTRGGMSLTTGAQASAAYSLSSLQRLRRDIDELLEIRANSELEQPKTNQPQRCVFITHGNTDEWRKVQPFIERDLGLGTVELAQEANAGQTIIEKLFANADRCDSAVIVWTGDDHDDKGLPRARENVMHEIGFFQGKYGRGRVMLLHEDGANVPTNLSGVVYSPFSKGAIDQCFHLLARELKSLYAL